MKEEEIKKKEEEEKRIKEAEEFSASEMWTFKTGIRVDEKAESSTWKRAEPKKEEEPKSKPFVQLGLKANQGRFADLNIDHD